MLFSFSFPRIFCMLPLTSHKPPVYHVIIFHLVGGCLLCTMSAFNLGSSPHRQYSLFLFNVHPLPSHFPASGRNPLPPLLFVWILFILARVYDVQGLYSLRLLGFCTWHIFVLFILLPLSRSSSSSPRPLPICKGFPFLTSVFPLLISVLCLIK